MLWFKKKVVEEEYVPPVKTKLYVLVEVQKQGLIQYFHENGVEVYFITTNPNDIIDELLLEEEPLRLIVIDSGRGKFDDKQVLEEIEGMVEIACDIGNISMFSNTNNFNNLKKRIVSNNKERASKISIYKSSGAVDILSHLKSYNEIYEDGGAKDVIPENVLAFQPTKIKFTDKEIDGLNKIVRESYDVNFEIGESDVEDSIPRYGRAVRNY